MDWRDAVVRENTKIVNIIKILDAYAGQIAVVVDEDSHVIGTVTDGDIRRGILRGVSLDSNAANVMHRSPFVISREVKRSEALEIMSKHSIKQLPMVDDLGCIIGIVLSDSLSGNVKKYDNPVFLMAGGLGSRLMPLTENCPKPMLKVGGKPILETIIENFKKQGFSNFYLSVKYKHEIIQDHFKDGSDHGVNISYLKEDTKLGTAGALSLIEKDQELPMIVMNGDLLTKVNYQDLLDFHDHHNAVATMGVREYDFQVPFGVLSLKNEKIISVDEKPIHKFFINAGIYLLSPETLKWIPKGKVYDMPSLFNDLTKAGHNTIAFPVREYWLDIGRIADFERAQKDIYEFF